MEPKAWLIIGICVVMIVGGIFSAVRMLNNVKILQKKEKDPEEDDKTDND